jgi:hypothetical protein
MSVFDPEYLLQTCTSEDLERAQKEIGKIMEGDTFVFFNVSRFKEGFVLSNCKIDVPKHFRSKGFKLMQKTWVPF